MAPQVPQVITFPVPGPVVVIQQPPTIQFAPTSAPILITTAPDTITINNTRTTFNSTTSLAETNQYSLYALAGALTLGMFALLIPIGPSRGRSPTRVRIRVNPTQDVFQNRVGDWTTPQAQRKLRQKVTKERSSPNKPRLSSWYSLINRIKNKMESIRVFYASDKQERQLRKKSTKFRQTNQQLRNDRTRSKRDDSSVKHGSSLKIQDYVYPLKTLEQGDRTAVLPLDSRVSTLEDAEAHVQFNNTTTIGTPSNSSDKLPQCPKTNLTALQEPIL